MMKEKQQKIFMQIILVLVIIFSIGSINILILALGFVSISKDILPVQVIIPYAIVSFVITLFVSFFHIITMIRNNRRKQDKSQSAASISRQILSKNN